MAKTIKLVTVGWVDDEGKEHPYPRVSAFEYVVKRIVGRERTSGTIAPHGTVLRYREDGADRTYVDRTYLVEESPESVAKMMKKKEFSTRAQVAVGVVVAFVVLIALIGWCSSATSSPSDGEDVFPLPGGGGEAVLTGERVVTTGTVRSLHGFGFYAQHTAAEVRSNGRVISVPFRGHTTQTPAWSFELPDGSSIIVVETAADCFPDVAFERQPSQVEVPWRAATHEFEDTLEYIGQEVRIAYTPLIGVYRHIGMARTPIAECAEGGETISPIPIEYATTEELEVAGYRPLRGMVTRLDRRNATEGTDLPELWVTLATVQLWDELREVIVYSSSSEYACPLNGNGVRPIVNERVDFWGMQQERGEGLFDSFTHDTFTCLEEGVILGFGRGELMIGPPYRKIPPARDVLNNTQTK